MGSVLGIAAVLAAASFVILLYMGRAYWSWVVPGAILLAASAVAGPASPMLLAYSAGVFGLLAVIFGVPAVRRATVTRPLFKIVGRMLPSMSETERVALDAGTVWWDGELFSGKPDWSKLLDFKVQELSAEERAFLAGPVEELCQMLDDWRVRQEGDMPPEVWEFMKTRKLFGMIIPKEYGGLGFSAAMHSAVVVKLASRSITAAVTVMVPNSLGPAELLLHYGTDEQKRHNLPRLADGLEIPCFGLTEPEAGSDAGGAKSTGVVCKGTWEGKEVLGMRLNWEKRYITLGPISTLIGLAFRLLDPDKLLGDKKDLGITCALIPSNLPGVDVGERHDPGVPFQNGPNFGKDVFVPLDFIIGGPKMAGQGWRMLMDCLSAGRSISLPSMSCGGAEVATRVISAYGLIREQFKTPIAYFEGVDERIARIAGYTYWMNAARRLTVGAVDGGEKPSVLSAINKAWCTEGMRVVVNDAMDVQAGAGICRGPRNTLATGYATLPIGITVEGANILTRSMIVFGQGAIRGHPHARYEIEAVAAGDIAKFDKHFFKHVGFVFTNAIRSLLLGLSGGALASGGGSGLVAQTTKQITRYSSAFAFTSDAAMGTLGGALKFREKLSGRLADALAWMYVASCAAKRFHDEGASERDRPFANWAIEHSLYEVQEALRGVFDNFPNRPVAWLVRALVFPFGARRRPPSDALGAEVTKTLLTNQEARRHLTADIFIPRADELGLGELEGALGKVAAAGAIHKKVRKAVKDGQLPAEPKKTLIRRAVEAGVIGDEELKRLEEADKARRAVIEVDSFSQEDYKTLR